MHNGNGRGNGSIYARNGFIKPQNGSLNGKASLLVLPKTPYLYIDSAKIKSACLDFCDTFSQENVFYAIKTNPDPQVASLIAQEGVGFEVASLGELNLVKELGVSVDKIVSGHPIKTPEFIQAAAEEGIRYLTIDSIEEIRKIKMFAPGYKVVVRMKVSNEGSAWPLTKKLGVVPSEVVPLLKLAKKEGLEPYGITFHVGSQCERPENWIKALEVTRRVWQEATDARINLQLVNLGGGFPVKYDKEVPERMSVLQNVNRFANELFPNGVDFFVEPGRSLVGDAGIFVSTVIGKAKRENGEWVYIDVGIYNGLFDAKEGVRYPMTTTNKGSLKKYTVAGPTCDSIDVIAENVELPEVEVGDRIFVHSAGAYTIACGSNFNGFSIPKVFIAKTKSVFDFGPSYLVE